MIQGVDSSGFHPTLAQVKAAYAQGIRAWGKYLPGPGIYSGDTKADYDTLKAGGMKTIAFCSGWADPAQMKVVGAGWQVDHICLDVEDRIRPDGSWVQGWLNTSGAGLYGSQSVSWGRTAPFFIMAAYPGYNPGATWSGQAPSVPHGWQWAGSVSAFGGAVDRSWLDDWFGGATPQGEDLTPEQDATLTRVDAALQFIINDPKLGLPPIAAVQQFAINDPNVGLVAIKAEIAELARQLAATVGSVGPKGDTGPAGPAATSVTINGTFPAS